MKNFLTKAFVCAGVVASAMALSSVAAFAEAKTYDYGTVQTSKDCKTKTWEFKSNLPSSNLQIYAGDTINGIIMGETDTSARVRTDSFMPRNSVFTVPVPAGSKGTITVTGLGNETKRTLTFKDGSNSVVLKDENDNTYSAYGAVADFTSEATANGGLTLTTSDADYKIVQIKIEITDETNKFEYIPSYNWKNPAAPAGLSGTLKWEAAVGKTNKLVYDGTDKSLKSDYEKWAITDTTGYKTATTTTDGDDFAVTVAPAADWFETAAVVSDITSAIGKITFSDHVTDNITKETVIADYFTATATSSKPIAYSSKGLRLEKKANNAYLTFTTKVPLTVVFNAGSNGDNKDSKLRVQNTETEKDVIEVTVCGGSSAGMDVAIYNLPAGTYRVDGGSGSRVVSLYSVDFRAANSIKNTKSKILTEYYCVSGTDTYLIHPFSGNLEDYASITLKNASGATAETYTTVYKSVKFSDGTEVSAGDIGANYLVAAKIKSTGGKAPAEKIANEKATLADFSFTNDAVVAN